MAGKVVFAQKENYTVSDIAEIMQILRGPGGCPWDAQQTHTSIKKNLIEETYEVIEAINRQDSALLCEELGDLLMQVVFHAQMSRESGGFTLEDVVNGLCKKLIERHPHVFGDLSAQDAQQALANWDAIKREKKGQKAGSTPMLCIPRELPALMRAEKAQQKAKLAGFDWQEIGGALEKLREELAELEEAVLGGAKEEAFEELGDLLFSAVNVARFLQCDAEEAMTAATDKFIVRFTRAEALAAREGLDMQCATLQELDRLWDLCKQGGEISRQ